MTATVKIVDRVCLQRADACPAALRSIARDAKRLVCVENDYLIRQGDTAERFFYLSEGFLRITQINQSGKEAILHIAGPGDMLGLAPGGRAAAYTANAVTATRCAVLAWNTHRLDPYCRADPGIALEIIRQLSGYADRLQAQTLLLATRTAEQKIAGMLLHLARRAGVDTLRGRQIGFPITRRDVAQMTGTTHYTVSRSLRAWQNEGILAGARRRITIVDQRRLAVLADEQG